MITTIDGLINAIANNNQRLNVSKATTTAKGLGFYQSLWAVAGMPGAGSTPATGSGAVPTSSTAGAYPFTNPTSPALTYVARASDFKSTAGLTILYDRLVHTSGLSGTTTTAQTVNTTAITRPNSTGTGVEAYIEWYSATGATQVNCTVSYTNSAGTSGQSTTFAFQVTPTVGQMQLIPLVGGDNGVQSVQSVTLSATTGTAGNFGITLLRRLAEIGTSVSQLQVLDAFAVGSPQVYDSACLTLMVMTTSAATGTIYGAFALVQG